MQGFVVKSLCHARLTTSTQWKRINKFCPEANQACTLVFVIDMGDNLQGISYTVTVVKGMSSSNASFTY